MFQKIPIFARTVVCAFAAVLASGVWTACGGGGTEDNAGDSVDRGGLADDDDNDTLGGDFGPPASQGCLSDFDCTAGFQCRQGACVSPDAGSDDDVAVDDDAGADDDSADDDSADDDSADDDDNGDDDSADDDSADDDDNGDDDSADDDSADDDDNGDDDSADDDSVDDDSVDDDDNGDDDSADDDSADDDSTAADGVLEFDTTGTLDYGDVTVGVATTKTITAINSAAPGAGDVTIDDAKITGAGATAFTIVQPVAWPQTLGAGDTLAIDVEFDPAATGAKTANLAFYSAALGGPHVINLKGSGVAAELTKNPPGVTDFGKLVQGVASTAKTFSITNVGTGAAHILDIQIDNPEFAVTTAPSPLPFEVAGNGGVASIDVQYTPADGGIDNARLTVTVDVPEVGTVVFDLKGEGIPQSATIPVAKAVVSGTQNTSGDIFMGTGGASGTLGLSGAGSTDPIGQGIQSYTWRVIDQPTGAAAQILGSGVGVDLQVNKPGAYKVGLKVTSKAGTESTNEAEVSANAHVNDTFDVEASYVGGPESLELGNPFGICAVDLRNVDIRLEGPGGAVCDEKIVTPSYKHDVGEGNFTAGEQCPGQWGENSTKPLYYDRGKEISGPPFTNRQWRNPEAVVADQLALSSQELTYMVVAEYKTNKNSCEGTPFSCPCTGASPTSVSVKMKINGQQTNAWTFDVTSPGEKVQLARLKRQFGQTTVENLKP